MKKGMMWLAGAMLFIGTVPADAICTADVAIKAGGEESSEDFKKVVDNAIKEAFTEVGGEIDEIKDALKTGKIVSINFQTMEAEAWLHPYHVTLCYNAGSPFYNCKVQGAAKNVKEFEKLLGPKVFSVNKITYPGSYHALYNGGAGVSFGNFYTVTLNPDHVACDTSRSEDADEECSVKIHSSIVNDTTPAAIAGLPQGERDQIETRRKDFGVKVLQKISKGKPKIALIGTKCN